jgi:hypothetical protein
VVYSVLTQRSLQHFSRTVSTKDWPLYADTFQQRTLVRGGGRGVKPLPLMSLIYILETAGSNFRLTASHLARGLPWLRHYHCNETITGCARFFQQIFYFVAFKSSKVRRLIM